MHSAGGLHVSLTEREYKHTPLEVDSCYVEFFTRKGGRPVSRGCGSGRGGSRSSDAERDGASLAFANYFNAPNVLNLVLRSEEFKILNSPIYTILR